MIKNYILVFVLILSSGVQLSAISNWATKRAQGIMQKKTQKKDLPSDTAKKEQPVEAQKKEKVQPLPTKADDASVFDTVKDKIKQVKETVKAKVEGVVEKVTKPKTSEEAKKQEELKKLVDEQMDVKRMHQDITDLSPLEKIFQKIGYIVATKTPGSSTKLMNKSIALHKAINNSAIGRLSQKLGDKSVAIKTSAYKFMEKDLDKKQYDDALKAPETVKRFEQELQAKVQESLEKEEFAKIEKGLLDRETAKGTKIDDTVSARIKAEAENQMIKIYTDADKQRVESDIKSDFKKKFDDNIYRELVDAKYVKEADESLKKLAQSDPAKYEKKLIEIGKRENLKYSEIKSLLENPQEKDNARRIEALRSTLIDDMKDDLKKNWIGHFFDVSAKARGFSQSPLVIGAALVGSSIFGYIIGQIQNIIEKSGMTSQLSSDLMNDDLQNVLSSGATGKLEMTVSQPGNGEDSLTGSQVLLNGTKSVFNFYSKFDKVFEKALRVCDYNDKYFNTLSKLTFPGGTASVGAAILFGYSGAGDISTGFTPVPVKVYPIQIMGQAVSVESLITSISNEDIVDLVGSLISCSPELIFCIKVISLLNTANKTISDEEKRVEFLNREMNLLYVRFIKTVSDRETARSNALELDDNKWEQVYLKYPAQCLQDAPKVVRDVIKNLYVDGIRDGNGNPQRMSFEQYLVGRFAYFEKMKDIAFDGDLKYEEQLEPLDDIAVERILFVIFLRAFNDMQMLETLLMKKVDPIEIKDISGKTKQIIAKKYFEQVTQNTFDKLQSAQSEFIGVMIDSADDLLNPKLQKAYQSAEKKYNAALTAYIQSTLKFKRLMCFYPYERTLGIVPERIFDFMTRECQRTYRQAINKDNYDAILIKIFNLYASNFSFTATDLLAYAKSVQTVNPPLRLREIAEAK